MMDSVLLQTQNKSVETGNDGRHQERTTKVRLAQLRRVAIKKSAPATSPVFNGRFDAAETREA
jgi:hypothetical protein